MKKFLLIGTVCFLFVAVKLHAVTIEQACTNAGSACVCSEPLDTATYTNVVTSLYKPTTASTKACSNSPGNEPSIIDSDLTNGTQFFGISTGEAITNLPSGHTVSHVLAFANGTAGGLTLGNRAFPTAARISTRFYIYFYSTVTLQTGGCQNTKMSTAPAGNSDSLVFTMADTSGNVVLYPFNAWNATSDCCNVGPGYTGGVGSPSYWVGRWNRIEIVVQRPTGDGHTSAGTGPIIQVFVKHAGEAENTEIKVLDSGDTNQSHVSPSDGRFTGTQNMTASNRQFGYFFAEFYVQNSSSCTNQGTRAYAAYTAYQWATNAGQRIGAATEIEGGTTTSNTPPNAPTALGLH